MFKFICKQMYNYIEMIMKLFFSLLLCFIFTSPVYAVESKSGEATGKFSFQGSFNGTGTLTFISTGGDAHLTTVCDLSTVDTATGERCEGVDLNGTFSGGPNGTAVFRTATGGELKLQLSGGRVFSFSAQGISMEFTVTDPSIFDAWVENTGSRDSGARVSDLSGQVEIACPPDLDAWDVMKMGRIIYVDCHLKTGEDSKAVISFSDMTTFEMKPESEIVIDTPPEKESKLSLLAGNIWVNVKQMVKDGTMKVHMSQAVAGIKGTRFILTETGKESKIEVTEGTVVFQSKANGNEISVSAGESVTATAAGLSDKTVFDPSKGQENWQVLSVPKGKKTVRVSNSTSNIIYFAGAGLTALILIIVGLVVFRKKQPVV
jgi:hypothetical protein